MCGGGSNCFRQFLRENPLGKQPLNGGNVIIVLASDYYEHEFFRFSRSTQDIMPPSKSDMHRER